MDNSKHERKSEFLEFSKHTLQNLLEGELPNEVVLSISRKLYERNSSSISTESSDYSDPSTFQKYLRLSREDSSTFNTLVVEIGVLKTYFVESIMYSFNEQKLDVVQVNKDEEESIKSKRKKRNRSFQKKLKIWFLDFIVKLKRSARRSVGSAYSSTIVDLLRFMVVGKFILEYTDTSSTKYTTFSSPKKFSRSMYMLLEKIRSILRSYLSSNRKNKTTQEFCDLYFTHFLGEGRYNTCNVPPYTFRPKPRPNKLKEIIQIRRRYPYVENEQRKGYFFSQDEREFRYQHTETSEPFLAMQVPLTFSKFDFVNIGDGFAVVTNPFPDGVGGDFLLFHAGVCLFPTDSLRFLSFGNGYLASEVIEDGRTHFFIIYKQKVFILRAFLTRLRTGRRTGRRTALNTACNNRRKKRKDFYDSFNCVSSIEGNFLIYRGLRETNIFWKNISFSDILSNDVFSDFEIRKHSLLQGVFCNFWRGMFPSVKPFDIFHVESSELEPFTNPLNSSSLMTRMDESIQGENAGISNHGMNGVSFLLDVYSPLVWKRTARILIDDDKICDLVEFSKFLEKVNRRVFFYDLITHPNDKFTTFPSCYQNFVITLHLINRSNKTSTTTTTTTTIKNFNQIPVDVLTHKIIPFIGIPNVYYDNSDELQSIIKYQALSALLEGKCYPENGIYLLDENEKMKISEICDFVYSSHPHANVVENLTNYSKPWKMMVSFILLGRSDSSREFRLELGGNINLNIQDCQKQLGIICSDDNGFVVRFENTIPTLLNNLFLGGNQHIKNLSFCVRRELQRHCLMFFCQVCKFIKKSFPDRNVCVTPFYDFFSCILRKHLVSNRRMILGSVRIFRMFWASILSFLLERSFKLKESRKEDFLKRIDLGNFIVCEGNCGFYGKEHSVLEGAFYQNIRLLHREEMYDENGQMKKGMVTVFKDLRTYLVDQAVKYLLDSEEKMKMGLIHKMDEETMERVKTSAISIRKAVEVSVTSSRIIGILTNVLSETLKNSSSSQDDRLSHDHDPKFSNEFLDVFFSSIGSIPTLLQDFLFVTQSFNDFLPGTSTNSILEFCCESAKHLPPKFFSSFATYLLSYIVKHPGRFRHSQVFYENVIPLVHRILMRLKKSHDSKTYQKMLLDQAFSGLTGRRNVFRFIGRLLSFFNLPLPSIEICTIEGDMLFSSGSGVFSLKETIQCKVIGLICQIFVELISLFCTSDTRKLRKKTKRGGLGNGNSEIEFLEMAAVDWVANQALKKSRRNYKSTSGKLLLEIYSFIDMLSNQKLFVSGLNIALIQARSFMISSASQLLKVLMESDETIKKIFYYQESSGNEKHLNEQIRKHLELVDFEKMKIANEINEVSSSSDLSEEELSLRIDSYLTEGEMLIEKDLVCDDDEEEEEGEGEQEESNNKGFPGGKLTILCVSILKSLIIFYVLMRKKKKKKSVKIGEEWMKKGWGNVLCREDGFGGISGVNTLEIESFQIPEGSLFRKDNNKRLYRFTGMLMKLSYLFEENDLIPRGKLIHIINKLNQSFIFHPESLKPFRKIVKSFIERGWSEKARVSLSEFGEFFLSLRISNSPEFYNTDLMFTILRSVKNETVRCNKWYPDMLCEAFLSIPKVEIIPSIPKVFDLSIEYLQTHDEYGGGSCIIDFLARVISKFGGEVFPRTEEEGSLSKVFHQRPKTIDFSNGKKLISSLFSLLETRSFFNYESVVRVIYTFIKRNEDYSDFLSFVFDDSKHLKFLVETEFIRYVGSVTAILRMVFGSVRKYLYTMEDGDDKDEKKENRIPTDLIIKTFGKFSKRKEWILNNSKVSQEEEGDFYEFKRLVFLCLEHFEPSLLLSQNWFLDSLCKRTRAGYITAWRFDYVYLDPQVRQEFLKFGIDNIEEYKRIATHSHSDEEETGDKNKSWGNKNNYVLDHESQNIIGGDLWNTSSDWSVPATDGGEIDWGTNNETQNNNNIGDGVSTANTDVNPPSTTRVAFSTTNSLYGGWDNVGASDMVSFSDTTTNNDSNQTENNPDNSRMDNPVDESKDEKEDDWTKSWLK